MKYIDFHNNPYKKHLIAYLGDRGSIALYPSSPKNAHTKYFSLSFIFSKHFSSPIIFHGVCQIKRCGKGQLWAV